jgi:large subunit ribosomal protein L3
MTIGIVGRKSGMTRVFTADGVSVPVSVIEVAPNRITQIKSVDTDGYSAVQVTIGIRRVSRVTKSEAGHFAKANVGAGSGVYELRNNSQESFEVGAAITIAGFAAGQKIDVTGTSKGKGFAGSIKRWNFGMQDATHGNSRSHRVLGSTGQCQSPGKVFKNKKMAGHLGDERVTVQNLEIVRIDAERNLLLVKGAIPGAPGGDVIVRPAVKARTNA